MKPCETCVHFDKKWTDEPCKRCGLGDPRYTEKAIDAPAVETSEVAVKFDTGKPRFDLIPPEAQIGLAVLYGIGAKKYADRNWEKGMDWTRIIRALKSHTEKFELGEDYDLEDGQHHMLSVAWNAFTLFTYAIRQIGTDDRVKGLHSFKEVVEFSAKKMKEA